MCGLGEHVTGSQNDNPLQPDTPTRAKKITEFLKLSGPFVRTSHIESAVRILRETVVSGVRIFTQVVGGELGGTAGGVVGGASGVEGGVGFFRPTSSFILLAILSRIFSYSECVISPESSMSRKLLNSGPDRFHRAVRTIRSSIRTCGRVTSAAN